jgi:hypothetical protein
VFSVTLKTAGSAEQWRVGCVARDNYSGTPVRLFWSGWERSRSCSCWCREEVAAPGTTNGQNGYASPKNGRIPFSRECRMRCCQWNVVSSVTDTAAFHLPRTGNASYRQTAALVAGTRPQRLARTAGHSHDHRQRRERRQQERPTPVRQFRLRGGAFTKLQLSCRGNPQRRSATGKGPETPSAQTAGTAFK